MDPLRFRFRVPFSVNVRHYVSRIIPCSMEAYFYVGRRSSQIHLHQIPLPEQLPFVVVFVKLQSESWRLTKEMMGAGIGEQDGSRPV
jgi:hypothetical protein